MIALLISGHVLLFYALPFKILGLVFMAFALFFLFIGGPNAIMVSVSLAITTLIFSAFLKISGFNEAIYYRPTEKFSYFDADLNHAKYQKNVRFEMEMPHGDLKALALHTEVTPVPRNVIFHTDSLGFRNYNNFHQQKYLLLGDSFIAGNGITQDEILTEQLLKEHSLDSYNLAYPGGIESYGKYLKLFEETFGNEHKVFLFLFEGNDFSILKKPEKPISKHIFVRRLKSYYKWFHKSDIYRFMFSLVSRYSLKNMKTEKIVEIKMVDDKPMAFLKEYISVTERDSIPNSQEFEKQIKFLKNKITHIFFIPTKYRVYYKHIIKNNPDKASVLPNRQWEFVQQMGNQYNIGATNLTSKLIEESDNLLQKGKLTYWLDDTHWNKNGISVATQIVAKKMSKSNLLNYKLD